MFALNYCSDKYSQFFRYRSLVYIEKIEKNYIIVIIYLKKTTNWGKSQNDTIQNKAILQFPDHSLELKTGKNANHYKGTVVCLMQKKTLMEERS